MLKKQFLMIAGILLAVSSCKNPDSVIGLDVQPPADKLALTIDTMTLETFSVSEDSLRAEQVLNLLGSDYSTVFGKTQATVYSQAIFGNKPLFGQSTDTLYADSLVLRLAYGGYYGDTTTSLTVHVYRLSESMSVDSPYYNTKAFATDSELAVLTFNPHPHTSLTEFGSTVVPQLRIPLSKWLADDILLKSGGSELSSNDNWIQYFKGIYLKVDPITTAGQGCISYFNMLSLDSRMTLYFHRGTVGDDSLYYDFLFNGARVNHQEHDYTGTAIASQLADSSVGSDVNYIQGAAGVKVKIKIPSISEFATKSNIAVNRAELIISKLPTSAETLSPPSSLWIQTIDAAGKANYIPDQFESALYYGGTYTSSTGQYSFNITHYFQDVTKGLLTDRGLYLGVSGAFVLQYYGVISANRVEIAGGKNADPALKMKLKLYYTKLD